MVDIVLFEPEIPNNTGAIARTCACTHAALHLIKPLGFDISDKSLKRAGLDYWHLLKIKIYNNIEEYFEANGDDNLWLATTKAPMSYYDCDFSSDTVFMFGKETAGLPKWLLEKYRERCIRIPMITDARSLNLSNAAAVLAYEALRQQNFKGLKQFGNMKLEDGV
ncbi:MAG: tRNA (uridine(34)/cytosine(34)/5-carboxymethylaminomethyluridine(34)-2'-O)-methyltransferase TrmL [Ruminococcaceae bacterium]|nr:tRNA (uridine(34)/cytosine(34)/5-carboxymethylaminomethyluridine(34)-2'-O)-methyltransferase TrmL [Oscillospiraceae bacterium]